MNHGMLDLSFQELLNSTLLLLQPAPGQERPKCFISYAWEDLAYPTPTDLETHINLQRWIQKLTRDLTSVGINVASDQRLAGNPQQWMTDNINSSQCVLVIGSPRYRVRANAPSSGVACELDLIQARLANNPGNFSVMPILYQGRRQDAFPDVLLARNADNIDIIDASESLLYYSALMSVERPTGLVGPHHGVHVATGMVPSIFPQLQTSNEYKLLWRLFCQQMQSQSISVTHIPAAQSPITHQFDQRLDNYKQVSVSAVGHTANVSGSGNHKVEQGSICRIL